MFTRVSHSLRGRLSDTVRLIRDADELSEDETVGQVFATEAEALFLEELSARSETEFSK